MISHSVLKRSVFRVSEYLRRTAEYYSDREDSHREGESFRYVPESFKDVIHEKGLESLEDRLACFSSRVRIGTDFCLSFGKEVTLLALANEQVRNEIAKVVLETIKLMQEGVYTRVIEDGRERYVRGEAMVHVFAHWTSREQDPQLHFHMVFSNRVYSPEARSFRSLRAEYLVANKFFFDIIAQYETARRLQELGYRAGLDDKGQAVLRNDRELVDLFNSRRRKILSVARAGASKRVLDRIAEGTRPNKSYVPLSELVREWHRKLKEAEKERFVEKFQYFGPIEDDEVVEVIEEVVRECNGMRLESVVQRILLRLGHLSQKTGRSLPPYKRVYRLLVERVNLKEESDLRGIKTFYVSPKPVSPVRVDELMFSQSALDRHRRMLEEFLGEPLEVHKRSGVPLNFRDFDNAFCLVLFRRGYGRDEVLEIFWSLSGKHAYLRAMTTEERHMYVRGLINRAEREYRQELDRDRDWGMGMGPSL